MFVSLYPYTSPYLQIKCLSMIQQAFIKGENKVVNILEFNFHLKKTTIVRNASK